MGPLRRKIEILTDKLTLSRLERNYSSRPWNPDHEESYLNAMSILDSSNRNLELCLFSLHCQVAKFLGFVTIDYVRVYLPPPFDIFFDEETLEDDVQNLFDEIDEDTENIEGLLARFLNSYIEDNEPSEYVIADILAKTASEYEQCKVDHNQYHFSRWTPYSNGSTLTLEAVFEKNRTDENRVDILNYENFQVASLGRYFPKRLDQHFGPEGRLSRAILQAKTSGYSDQIVQAVATTIMSLPEGTIVTTIPDRLSSKYKRMQCLIEDLNSFYELNHLSFSKKIFEFSPEADSIHGLSYEKRVTQLKNNLQTATRMLESSSYSVLVIDDVITTGATFLRAYELLKNTGVKDIYFIAMARTVSD